MFRHHLFLGLTSGLLLASFGPSAAAADLAPWEAPYDFGHQGTVGYRTREAARLRPAEPMSDQAHVLLLNEDQALRLPRGGDKTRLNRISNAIYAEGAFDIQPRGALGFYILHGEALERARSQDYRQKWRATRTAVQGAWRNDRRLVLGLEAANTAVTSSLHSGDEGQSVSANYQSAAFSMSLLPNPAHTLTFAYHPGMHRDTAGGSIDEIGRLSFQYNWQQTGPWGTRLVLNRHFNRQARASLYNDSFSAEGAVNWYHQKTGFEALLALAPAFARGSDFLTPDSAGASTVALRAQHALQELLLVNGTIAISKPQHSDATGQTRHMAVGFLRYW